MSNIRPFHLAFPVHDLDEARAFWGGVMECSEGRSCAQWIDFNFYDHQIVTHLVPGCDVREDTVNAVDGHGVPVPHFGVILAIRQWQELADRLKTADVKFEIEPYIRFAGQAGEQATMFFKDPSGNAIEMKAFANIEQLFATD